MAGPNDLVHRQEDGTFKVYVQIQDGTEHCGTWPTLEEAVEHFREASDILNHYIPPFEKVRFHNHETGTSCSLAEAIEDHETKLAQKTLTVYKLAFLATGGAGVFYFVLAHSGAGLKQHLLFGEEAIGNFGQTRLALITYQPSIQGAIQAVVNPHSEPVFEDVSWRILRQFEVKESVIESLAARANEAHKADQEFQSSYKQFEKDNECYRAVLTRSRRGNDSAPTWGWYAHLPEEPAIGKSAASKGRLDATLRFQTKEEAKQDWLRVAAEKGITDFELDVVVFS